MEVGKDFLDMMTNFICQFGGVFMDEINIEIGEL